MHGFWLQTTVFISATRRASHVGSGWSRGGGRLGRCLRPSPGTDPEPGHAETLAGLGEQPRRVSGVNAPDSRQRCVRAANLRTGHRSSRPAAQEGLRTAGWGGEKKARWRERVRGDGSRRSGWVCSEGRARARASPGCLRYSPQNILSPLSLSNGTSGCHKGHVNLREILQGGCASTQRG